MELFAVAPYVPYFYIDLVHFSSNRGAMWNVCVHDSGVSRVVFYKLYSASVSVLLGVSISILARFVPQDVLESAGMRGHPH